MNIIINPMNRLYMAIFYTIKYWMNIKDTYNGQMLDSEEQKKNKAQLN